MQSFDIGDSRNVHIDVDKNNDVTISVHQDVENDGGKRKDIFFTARLWVRFVQSISVIDNAVQWAIPHEPTTFQLHIGGQWHVGVSDRFHHVDIRRWFYACGASYDVNDLRPITYGITLTFKEWEKLKKVVEQMNEQFPQFIDLLPCFRVNQHQSECCFR